MKRKKVISAVLFAIIAAISPLQTQSLKVAVTGEPGNSYSSFFANLSRKSGITLNPVAFLPGEMENAFEDGLVDLAVLSETEKSLASGISLGSLWESPMILIGPGGFTISERNLPDLKTIGVFTGDQVLLERNLIDPYSLDARIQPARHYDLLVKIMSTGRVSAIYLPLKEFENSLNVLDEARENFGNPFESGIKKEFLFLSGRRAAGAAPLRNALKKALDELKTEGDIY